MVPGIYCWTHRASVKRYVGQGWDVHKRMMKHPKHAFYRSASKNDCPLFYNALRKHGVDAFDCEVICELPADTDQKTLNAMEIFYIDQLHSFARRKDGKGHGYNLDEGGGGSKGRVHSEESKAKISKSKKGQRSRLGAKLTEATKGKISKAHMGKKLSEETKRKISKAQKGRSYKRRKGLKGYYHTKSGSWRISLFNRLTGKMVHFGTFKTVAERDDMVQTALGCLNLLEFSAAAHKL